LPCNHDDDGLIVLGNIKDLKIKEAWNLDKLNKIRELHKNGNAHLISACDGCYLRDSEMAKLESNNKLSLKK
jgi:MoaA/NifB/PqqE/SkfB family radical SAM enzyme